MKVTPNDEGMFHLAALRPGLVRMLALAALACLGTLGCSGDDAADGGTPGASAGSTSSGGGGAGEGGGGNPDAKPVPGPVPDPTPTPVGMPVGQPTQAVIGASGGTLISEDGQLTLIVPPGAVDADTDFGIQAVTNESFDGLGLAYELTPDGAQFDVPRRRSPRWGSSSKPSSSSTGSTRRRYRRTRSPSPR